MQKSIAVLGMGRFGRYVTEILSEKNTDLLIADKNRETVNQFADRVSYAVTADLQDPEAIADLGLSNMDVVIVAMGSSLEASILCAMIAKEQGVKTVYAKSSSDVMTNILKKVGVDEIIYAEKESAARLARKLTSSTFLDYFDVGSNLSIVKMKPRENWIGHSLKELRLRERLHINVIAMKDGREFRAHINPDTPITEDAQLLIVVDKDNLDFLSAR